MTRRFIVPADGGTPRQATSGDWNVGARFDYLAGNVGYAWAPDGRTIADGFADSLADNNYDASDILSIDVAGHGGASGRYDRLREIALDYAFILRHAK